MIVPTFTYVATAEVIALLGLTPVMVDVDEQTFCIDLKQVEEAIGPKTKAIVPVHLYGQCADMEGLMNLADGRTVKTTPRPSVQITIIQTVELLSLEPLELLMYVILPSKNLGCFGDGGALFTNDDELAIQAKMIASHGQSKQYVHDVVGCNSRLDAIQAGVLRIKLRQLDDFASRRRAVADKYDQAFADVEEIITPVRNKRSTHVFHNTPWC